MRFKRHRIKIAVNAFFNAERDMYVKIIDHLQLGI
jgi:hypothetical protein